MRTYEVDSSPSADHSNIYETDCRVTVGNNICSRLIRIKRKRLSHLSFGVNHPGIQIRCRRWPPLYLGIEHVRGSTMMGDSRRILVGQIISRRLVSALRNWLWLRRDAWLAATQARYRDVSSAPASMVSARVASVRPPRVRSFSRHRVQQQSGLALARHAPLRRELIDDVRQVPAEPRQEILAR